MSGTRFQHGVRWLVWAAVCCVVVMFGLPWLEGRLIYLPFRHMVAFPEHYGLKAEPLELRTPDDVTLVGWWIHGDGRRLLIWYQGNGGNQSLGLENAKRFQEWFGVDLFMVDYRGYGKSGGGPSEAGLYVDGRTIYDAAVARGYRPDQIVLLGRSLGAAVAVQVALDRRPGGVVLETPFLSVASVAREHYPWVPAFLIRTRFDNERKIARLAGRKLIVQAERDEVVSPADARRLYDLAAGPKSWHVLRGARHNDTYQATSPEYQSAWRDILTGPS